MFPNLAPMYLMLSKSGTAVKQDRINWGLSLITRGCAKLEENTDVPHVAVA